MASENQLQIVEGTPITLKCFFKHLYKFGIKTPNVVERLDGYIKGFQYELKEPEDLRLYLLVQV